MLKASLNVVSLTILGLTVAAAAGAQWAWARPSVTAALVILGIYLAAAPRMIRQWERGVLLRLGKFRVVLEPGVTWILPGVDSLLDLIDMRVRSTSFSAEKALTRDTVPVDVDAVLFWIVTDARLAVLGVQRFPQTVSWAAQTTFRDIIGRTELVRMISDRQALDDELRSVIDGKTSDWGIRVQSVEIRDVRLPAGLEDAMSRQAQASREREARVILAESERKVAEQMQAASDIYRDDHVSLQLRAMNMTYEAIKERGALMVVPSGMTESINPGVIGMGAAAFRHEAEES